LQCLAAAGSDVTEGTQRDTAAAGGTTGETTAAKEERNTTRQVRRSGADETERDRETERKEIRVE
jgi:hypothetical protein